jgi:glycosyltransferase involved in cell wall biosynthesis
MRIIVVADDIDAVGGIQTATHTLAQHLARRGHHVHVVGIYRNPAPAVLPDRPRYQRTVLDAPPPTAAPDPGWLRASKQRMRQILDAHPHVVIMSSVHASLWLHDLHTSGHLRIGHYHGSYEYARTHYHLRVIRDLWPHFDASVFLSRDDATGFATGFATGCRLRATWIPNPLPPPAAGAGPAAAPAGPGRVLAVGRLTPIKRFDLAITAFAWAAVAGWQLHIIGDGEQHHALRRLAAHHLPDPGPAGPAIVFRGRLPSSRLPAEYAAAYLLVVTSDHEGFGMVIAEAAAAGTPTVAFDVSGGVRSLVQHDRTGLLVPPGDNDALTRALHTLMTDPHRRRRLGHAARTLAAGLHPDTITDRWEQLLTGLAHNQEVRP